MCKWDGTGRGVMVCACKWEGCVFVRGVMGLGPGHLHDPGFLRVLESWNCFGISFSLFKGLEKL